jgi:hypothetical protein
MKKHAPTPAAEPAPIVSFILPPTRSLPRAMLPFVGGASIGEKRDYALGPTI